MSEPLAPEHRRLLEDALRRVRRTEQRLAEVERGGDSIAITGIGLRMPPDVSTLDAYWAALTAGHDSVSWLDRDEDGHRNPEKAEAQRWRPGAVLSEIDSFDAEFFGIPAVEARKMDPQQRMFLECSWEALEDAGIPASTLRGTATGVYAGVYNVDYHLMQAGDPEGFDAYTAGGLAHSIIANRVSYLLDLSGPSMALDTGCSSSLVAVHLAMRALRSGECDFALVGGVNAILASSSTLLTEAGFPLSPHGRSRTFDADADGFVRGEGCAVLLLERESSARGSGRRVHGLLRGSAVNHGGRANGMSAPNPSAQKAVLRAALRDGGVDAQEVGYIEAHGTATPLGDPIEFGALNDVYGAGSDPCAVGAVKAQIGHLEAAAGVAGLVKTALVLRNGLIPGQPYFKQLNPEIRASKTRLFIPSAVVELAPSSRFGAVSSFGFGGANAHVVLEVPTQPEPEESESRPSAPLTLPLSARSEPALADLSRAYARMTETMPEAQVRMAGVALMHRRDHHPVRRMVVADSLERLRAELAEPVRRTNLGQMRRLFVFSGQGAQWAEMGQGLLRLPEAAEELRTCNELVRDVFGWSLIDALGDPAVDTTDIGYVHACVPAVQLALASQLAAWGVHPDGVVGHSLGELPAAVTAGALTRRDMFAVLARRAQLIEQRSAGATMAAVAASPNQVAPLLENTRVEIVAVNSAASVAVCGPSSDVRHALARFESDGIAGVELTGAYPSHCRLLEGADAELVAALKSMTVGAPELPFFSTALGGARPTELDAEYWGQNLRSPVRFADAVTAALADAPAGSTNVLVELAPHPVLSRDLQRIAELAEDRDHVEITSTMRRGQDAELTLLRAAALLYETGQDLRWAAIRPAPVGDVPLVGYPWQRKRYWWKETEPADGSRSTSTSGSSVPVSAEAVMGALHGWIADSLGVPSERVETDAPLTELGLDSVTVVDLSNRMRRRFGRTVDFARLLSGAGIREIAVQAVTGSTPSASSGPPLLWPLSERPDREAHLVCFPHAGGEPTSFNSWTDLLADRMEVWGAPIRSVDAPADPRLRWSWIVDKCVDALLELSGRITLYGHSMGSVFAYETARGLSRKGRPAEHLVVTGRQAPHVDGEPFAWPDDPGTLLRRVAEYYGGVPAELTADAGASRFLGERLRHDFETHAHYRWRPGVVLETPITVLIGADDPAVDEHGGRAWSDHTRAGFAFSRIPGGHFPDDVGVRAVIAAISAGPQPDEPNGAAGLDIGGGR